MYKMTEKSNTFTSSWEKCNATTLTGAKKEATSRYGAGYLDNIIVIAEDNEMAEVVASKKIADKEWINAI